MKSVIFKVLIQHINKCQSCMITGLVQSSKAITRNNIVYKLYKTLAIHKSYSKQLQVAHFLHCRHSYCVILYDCMLT